MNGRSSNEERFQALFRKYHRSIVRYFIRAFRVTEEDAEDLAQDTFTRCFQAIDDYRGDAEWAFLEMIALNVGRNRVRGLNTHKRKGETLAIDDPNEAYEPVAPPGPDYAELEEAELKLKRLHAAIAELPPGQRQAVQLYLDDFTYEEIRKVLQISTDAVKSRLRDAKKLLRARLGDVDLPEDE